MGLFEDNIPFNNVVFFDFAEQGDKAGALRHLQSLTVVEIEREVLESGFSMIGRKHGKPLMMQHALKQIGVRKPVNFLGRWS